MAKVTYSKMKIEDLQEELVKRGYAMEDLEDLSKEALEQLKEDDASPAKEEEPEEESEVEETPAPKASKAKGKGGDSIMIVKRISPTEFEFIRTYSAEVHGDEAADLADQFLAKNQDKKFEIYEGTVDNFIVSYREYDKKEKAEVQKVENFRKVEDAVVFKNKKVKASLTFRVKREL